MREGSALGLTGSQERARIKRVMADQAVELAMQSRWAEAAEINAQLIETYPKEVAAHNRLGKALLELTRYDDSREAYNHSLRIDPLNTIAQKNLLRLDKLMEESIVPEVSTTPVDPSLFIEETGRTTTTSLVELASAEILAKMNAGDVVELRVEGTSVLAYNAAGDALGRLEPKVRQRLIRLINMGNQYAAIVTSADDQSLRIILRETYRDPSMGSRPSFAPSGDVFRGYARDSLLRYELDEDDDDDEADEPGMEPDQETELATGDIAIDESQNLAADDEDEEP
jgi:tetratricopeptide (TPR) repeat protein